MEQQEWLPIGSMKVGSIVTFMIDVVNEVMTYIHLIHALER